MANITGTGHAKNVDNLDTLVVSILGFGTAYNPAKSTLKYPALQSLASNGRNIIAAEHSAEVIEKNAKDLRASAFKPLSPHVTRVMNALRASGASAQAIDFAYAIARKIQGAPASSKKHIAEPSDAAGDAKPVRHISSRHMDFESRLNNLDLFIKQLQSIPQYNPNEPELKVSGLIALYNDLKNKNSAAVTASVQANNARIARDEFLYRESTGLVDIAIDAKTYVKSVYSVSSPQFKQISKLAFRKL